MERDCQLPILENRHDIGKFEYSSQKYSILHIYGHQSLQRDYFMIIKHKLLLRPIVWEV